MRGSTVNPGLIRPGNSEASFMFARIAGVQFLALQRPDEGWAQLATLESDAYATGRALVALDESGTAVTDPAFRRGIQALLNTQFADGSWFVKTRTIPLQPLFEIGFPHGRDQWISAAATNWATLALTALAR